MVDGMIFTTPNPAKDFLTDDISKKIVHLLAINGPMRASDLIDSSPEFENYKISQMTEKLTKLYDNGDVCRYYKGRHTYYKVNAQKLMEH